MPARSGVRFRFTRFAGTRRLSPPELEALRAGQRLSFRAEPLYAGDRQLPLDLERGVRLFDALNHLADAMQLRWGKDDEWLQIRSAAFFHDRLKEVPNRELPGGFGWKAPGTEWLHWLLTEEPENPRRFLPRPWVRERTREAALAAAGGIDPAADESQIHPTGLNLAFLYVPGPLTGHYYSDDARYMHAVYGTGDLWF